MRKPLVLLVVMGGLILSVFMGVGHGDGEVGKVSASTSLPSPSQEQSVVNCRFGMAIERPLFDVTTTQEIEWLPTWGAGWYIDFVSYPRPTADQYQAEQAKIISVGQQRDSDGNRLDEYRVTPNFDDLADLVQENSGSLWLIGNEVDRVEVQGDTMPQVYAKAYHEIYHHIKAIDPTAQVANSGLVQVTPGRLQYLDLMWDAYEERYNQAMPVDVWNAHIYVLPERLPLSQGGGPNEIASVALGTDINLGIFESGNQQSSACTDHTDNTYCFSEHDEVSIVQDQVRAMRRWMKDRGQQNKPLIITEYGILLPYYDGDGCKEDEYGQCFDQQRVSTYMHDTMDWFESASDQNIGFPGDDFKLVQQWLWYSAYNDGVGHASNILKADYINQPAGHSPSLTEVGNAFIEEVDESPLLTDLVIERTTAQHGERVVIGADIRNAGNVPLQFPVTVSFYANSGLTNLIGQVSLSPELAGCGREVQSVSTTWSPPSTGFNRFWVKVDSNNAVFELDENNNSAMGRVIKSPTQIWMPIIDQ